MLGGRDNIARVATLTHSMQPQPVDPPKESRRDRAVFVALLVLMASLPLPWGSTPDLAVALFGLATGTLVVVRLLLALRGFALTVVPIPARVVLAGWLAWLGWCGLYLLPLPDSLLALLSPSAHTLHASVGALPQGRAMNTISIVPGATLDQLLLGTSYFALFWTVLVTVARNRFRQRWLLTVVMASGLVQALYGSVMTLSGWEFGFFEPKQHGHGWATGTFVNRNHLAGYLELTLAAGIALVLADLRPQGARTWKQTLADLIDLALSPRMRTRVMIAVMVIALVLTRSRMGNIAFFISLAICANAYIWFRNPRYLLKSLLFFASLFIIDLLIVSEQYGLKKVVQRIEATELQTEQRALVFRDLVPVIEEYGLIGAGPGSFAVAFSPHRSADIHGYFDHAHNDYAEFLIETGVVGCGLLALIAGMTFLHGFLLVRRRRDPMASALGFAGVMGLMTLGIHGLADFNLRIPAVAATLVALMAVMLSCSSRSTKLGPRASEESNRALRKEDISA
ncbi:MAG TPA: O-antigen ligase family protein [Verrucomicrobiae bacterium]|nr:O-antigen ligase family protein [Verrucomicrobiae bacterium]